MYDPKRQTQNFVFRRLISKTAFSQLILCINLSLKEFFSTIKNKICEKQNCQSHIVNGLMDNYTVCICQCFAFFFDFEIFTLFQNFVVVSFKTSKSLNELTTYDLKASKAIITVIQNVTVN